MHPVQLMGLPCKATPVTSLWVGRRFYNANWKGPKALAPDACLVLPQCLTPWYVLRAAHYYSYLCAAVEVSDGLGEQYTHQTLQVAFTGPSSMP